MLYVERLKVRNHAENGIDEEIADDAGELPEKFIGIKTPPNKNGKYLKQHDDDVSKLYAGH